MYSFDLYDHNSQTTCITINPKRATSAAILVTPEMGQPRLSSWRHAA